MKRYCRVAVDSPVTALDRPFDYRIPDRMAGRVEVGSVVRVPLHGRRIRAYVTELLDVPEVAAPKDLSALVSPTPVFDRQGIALARWVARRYVAPLGVVLHQAVPGRYSIPDPPGCMESPDARSEADTLDSGAWERLDGGRHACLLLSGDLEARAIVATVARATEAGVQSLLIAPRVDRCEALAGRIPGARLLHGGLRPAERAEAWADARSSHLGVLVGGRAALFAPLPRLGLVVVAGAHDRSLKEERTPHLHTLHVARERARMAGAGFLAVSPAPPLELAADPDIEQLSPGRRGRNEIRPEVTGVRGGPVTTRLLEVVRSAVDAGGDALVFAGRRGFALRVRCRECGWYPRCERCRTGLTMFEAPTDGLRCRPCGARAEPPAECPVCGSVHLDGAGWGNERIAVQLRGHELGAPVLRVDADHPIPSNRPRPAVLVGTQAALWGLRDETVAAVCVADLDQLLGLPDFRAGEHAFGLLEDLAAALAPGGRFLVQTREPTHHVVQAFTRRSYRYFADRELPVRRDIGYPPYGVIVHLELPEGSFEALRAAASRIGGEVRGPVPGRGGRVAALLRSGSLEPMLDELHAFAAEHPQARIDVDPVDVM